MKFTIAATLFAVANADVYMHKPRGSNNRLNEANANRNNGNRLFDSQNNNRGGYNVGDKTDDAFNGGDTSDELNDGTQNNQQISWVTNGLDKGQYAMQFFEGSELGIEWTNQHGCGGNEEDNSNKLNCNMVIQFACNTNNAVQDQPALQMAIKDGRNTNAPDTANGVLNGAPPGPNGTPPAGAQHTQNDNNGRGRHETEAWYYECTQRERDLMLFTADQNLDGNQAIYTRQNPNGGRRGLECAEERDYYPYWTPTPFMDIAYLTSNPEDCNDNAEAKYGSFDVLGKTQNTNNVQRCAYNPTGTPNEGVYTEVAKARTMEQCQTLIDTPPNGATSGEISWKSYNHEIDAPVCKQGGWSRVNHLGNSVDGQTLVHNWTLPMVSTTAANGVGKYTQIYNNEVAKCIVRLRYNISTDDYDIRNTNAMSNEDNNNGVISPVENNPTVDVKASLQGLRLAINTNQFGRTFQDRSHAFYIKKRSTAAGVTGKIINLTVRGKRGNIVQTFPSTEYDFTPNRVHVGVGDVLHLQWTGSNTHNNGNPAGDGQAGDAGEGTGGTDRHNIVALLDKDQNYPVPYDKVENGNGRSFNNVNLIKEMGCYKSDGTQFATEVDCAVALASSNYFESKAAAEAGGTALSQTLDNAYASLHGGVFLKATKAGEYNYMCTRNNNFTNRSQKGVVIVN